MHTVLHAVAWRAVVAELQPDLGESGRWEPALAAKHEWVTERSPDPNGPSLRDVAKVTASLASANSRRAG